MSRLSHLIKEILYWGALVGASILLLFAIGLALMTILYDQAGLGHRVVKTIPSPNGRYEAVITRTDCGALASDSEHVWIKKATPKSDKSAYKFDDTAESVYSEVFAIGNLHWADSTTLVIEGSYKNQHYRPTVQFKQQSGLEIVKIKIVESKQSVQRRK